MYLKPGFAFGGSCLPKDVRAMQYRAKELDLEMPVLSSILPSNRLQVEHAITQILETGHKRVGLLGFSFKDGTDDLRESPMVTLAEALIGKGLSLRIYDKHVALARLVGANKDYIEQQISHLSSLMVPTIDQVLDESDVIVIGTRLRRVRGRAHAPQARTDRDRSRAPATLRGATPELPRDMLVGRKGSRVPEFQVQGSWFKSSTLRVRTSNPARRTGTLNLERWNLEPGVSLGRSRIDLYSTVIYCRVDRVFSASSAQSR